MNYLLHIHIYLTQNPSPLTTRPEEEGGGKAPISQTKNRLSPSTRTPRNVASGPRGVLTTITTTILLSAALCTSDCPNSLNSAQQLPTFPVPVGRQSSSNPQPHTPLSGLY